MDQQKKKITFLLIIATLMGLVVSILYPIGSELLHRVRDHYEPAVYGKEIIYPEIENGGMDIADEILQNRYEISRFEPITIENITWRENPYNDIYWRFNYYNLEPTRNLLFAWKKTNKQVYRDKLIEIVESFVDSGINGPYSWDYHGTAFRTMTLINIRQKLFNKGELSSEIDQKILESLIVHGDFLADQSHFESDYSHGLDQSAALYLLAVNFPDLQGSNNWLEISSKRLVQMQKNIIDDDGILVENSPYYHFYVLEKFIAINKYLKQNNLEIEGFSEEMINKMISYATYILHPDLSIPTIGASISRQINFFGLYKEISETNPDLLYVLTKGNRGKKPEKLSVHYPSSGQTIMRSGWGKGDDFLRQTQLIFDVGDYRTNHSDLDALSFNLFGAGIPLIPDAGLYNYENGPFRSYFHGTRSHNTVLVDGKDQNIGVERSVYPGRLEEGDGYVYQSGENYLNDEVSHKRAIVMIEDSTILILDNLKSSSTHTYEQMFHLFPGAQISSDGLNITATGNEPEQILNIKQFVTSGVELGTVLGQKDNNYVDGWCSLQYKVAIPCYSISYKQKGRNVSYVTAINIGKEIPSMEFNDDVFKVKTRKSEYIINISETPGVDQKIEVNKQHDTSKLHSVLELENSLNNLKNWNLNPKNDNSLFDGILSINENERSLKLVSPMNGSRIDASIRTNLDLSNKNLYFKFKVDNVNNLSGFDLYLSNNNFEKYSKISVKSYIETATSNQNGQWIQFGVAKGGLRKDVLGGWHILGENFDWSQIDNVKVLITSKAGKTVMVNIKDFSVVSDQDGSYALIVFDDGWSSVLDAAKIMNSYGLKGNVGVVTNSVGARGYLTIDELKMLQNEYGWNIANHTSLHKNAVKTYIETNNEKGFENDLTGALKYLIRNDINSAPNWFIYPDGSRDSILDQVVGKYYKFARSTIAAPESSPFANPFSVATLPVYSDDTDPIDVHNAVSDAIKYKQTLFIMFHKISQGEPVVHTEYSISKFESIIKDIFDQGISVVTFSELDIKNSIPNTIFTLNEAIPSQFNLDISVNQSSSIFQDVIMIVWNYLVNIKEKIS